MECDGVNYEAVSANTWRDLTTPVRTFFTCNNFDKPADMYLWITQLSPTKSFPQFSPTQVNYIFTQRVVRRYYELNQPIS